MKFSQFWQQFEACVDKQEMPAVTKFNYLLGLLKGDARNLLEGLPVTAENYDKGKDLLQKRFGRKQVVIFAHVQALLKLEIPEASSSSKLSQYYDRLAASVRALESMGVSADQFGVILTPIIVSRLPEEIHME